MQVQARAFTHGRFCNITSTLMEPTAPQRVSASRDCSRQGCILCVLCCRPLYLVVFASASAEDAAFAHSLSKALLTYASALQALAIMDQAVGLGSHVRTTLIQRLVPDAHLSLAPHLDAAVTQDDFLRMLFAVTVSMVSICKM